MANPEAVETPPDVTGDRDRRMVTIIHATRVLGGIVEFGIINNDGQPDASYADILTKEGHTVIGVKHVRADDMAPPPAKSLLRWMLVRPDVSQG